MKPLFLNIALIFFSLIQAQMPELKAGKISNAAVSNDEYGQHIYFTLSSEANIKQYVIEGRTDSSGFEIIGTVPSCGNCVTPRSYGFNCSGHSYTWYRIKQIDMNGTDTATANIFAGDRAEPVKLKPALPLTSFNKAKRLRK